MPHVWVIRSEHGKYAGHFVDGAYVAAGWLRGNDLSDVKSKEELTAMYRQVHRDHSSRRVGANVSQLWLFLQMKAGDYVITPCADSQWLYYGRVVSLPYYYAPNHPDDCWFPHRRPVAWTGRRINRSEFSDVFQNSIEFAAKTAFDVYHREEFLERVVQRNTTQKYSIDEVCKRAEKIYSEKIKAQVEPQKNGKFIIIDIESGDYEVNERALVASRLLQERRPEAVGFLAKVGYGAAYRIGWRPVGPQ